MTGVLLRALHVSLTFVQLDLLRADHETEHFVNFMGGGGGGPCIPLAWLKSESTNQNSAWGNNFTVLTSM